MKVSKKREGWTGKEEGRHRKVGGLEKKKDVVWTVLQSGPLRLRAEKDVVQDVTVGTLY